MALGLLPIASAQLAAAVSGQALGRLDDEPISVLLYTAPTDNASAYGRAGFWLATASRLAQGRGVSSAALTSAATAAVARTGMSQNVFMRWYYDPLGDNDIGQILADAATTAAPIPEVASQLRQLANVPAIEQRQELMQEEGLFAQWRAEIMPEWTQEWWFKPTMISLGVVVALGVAAYALRPYVEAFNAIRRNPSRKFRRNRRRRIHVGR